MTAAGRAGIPGAAAWVVLAALPLKLALALGTDLSPDEAYYLCAARRPELVPPMPDHPPFLPWLLRLGDQLLAAAPVELRVRVWPLLLSTVTGLLAVALARRRGANETGQVAAAWLGTWTLLPMAGGFVATPDVVALPAIVLLLLSTWRASATWPSSLGSPSAATPASTTASSPRTSGEASMRPALVALAVTAAGALAKVVVVPVACLVALLGKRPPLVRVALVIACVASLPWLVPSLRFQLGHATDATAPWSALGAASAVGQLVSAQLALWSPWAVVLGLMELARRWLPAARASGPDAPPCPDATAAARADLAVAVVFTTLVLASTLARAVPAEPNWWAPAAIVVVVAAARRAQELARTYRTTMLWLAVSPTLLVASHVLHPWLPLSAAGDPTARLHGWSTGREPLGAPGLGAYAVSAERCVYRDRCDEMDSFFDDMKHSLEGGLEESPDR